MAISIIVTISVPGISYDGGYHQYKSPMEAVAAVPGSLNAAEAAPLLCAGVTTFKAPRHSGARPGDPVAVQGIVGLGHLGVWFANEFGYKVAAIRCGSKNAAVAKKLGASVYIDSKLTTPAESLQNLGGGRRQFWQLRLTPSDSDDTLRFSEVTGARPMIETYPLEKLGEAYERMISGHAHFRAV